MVACNPDPILLLEHLGRSWDCENDVVEGCGSRFGAKGSGDRGWQNGPDFVNDDEIATSRARTIMSVLRLWPVQSWCSVGGCANGLWVRIAKGSQIAKHRVEGLTQSTWPIAFMTTGPGTLMAVWTHDSLQIRLVTDSKVA